MPSWMDDALDDRRQRGLFRSRRQVRSAQGPRILIREREFVNFSSNDYLALAHDPRLAHAAADAARRSGCGAGASPLVSGHLAPLRALEKELALWEGTESALVFSSGFVANLAVATALVDREDAIFSDELNHASLIDGCRLSRARVHVYRHRDSNHLEDLLRRHTTGARRLLIVSDSVFSMDGDLAPLAELYDLARRFDALLLLDEAHATGLLGAQGRGLAEIVPPPGDVDPDSIVRVGTLSKAIGTQGGFVSGSRTLIRWLVNHARPYIFSTALAPPIAAAAREAVRIIRAEPQRREHVLKLSARFGAPVPIVPVIAGAARDALRLSGRLRRRGLLVPAIRPPSVPEGTARLRISLSSGHTVSDIETLRKALAEECGAFCRSSPDRPS